MPVEGLLLFRVSLVRRSHRSGKTQFGGFDGFRGHHLKPVSIGEEETGNPFLSGQPRPGLAAIFGDGVAGRAGAIADNRIRRHGPTGRQGAIGPARQGGELEEPPFLRASGDSYYRWRAEANFESRLPGRSQLDRDSRFTEGAKRQQTGSKAGWSECHGVGRKSTSQRAFSAHFSVPAQTRYAICPFTERRPCRLHWPAGRQTSWISATSPRQARAEVE